MANSAPIRCHLADTGCPTGLADPSRRSETEPNAVAPDRGRRELVGKQ
jgi:hypothetical protein